MARVDIREEKKKLRAEFKLLRQKMSLLEKQNKDFKILNSVLSLKEYKNSEILLTYVSTDIEVDTKALIIQALLDKKIVAVPRCVEGKVEMKFYVISSLEDLEKGSFGVLEPSLKKCKELTNFENAVCILPGLGFDLKGYRLGYGKGYYDRFLSEFRGRNIGLCYNICLKALIPHGRYDKMVDILVTEKFIKRFSNK